MPSVRCGGMWRHSGNQDTVPPHKEHSSGSLNSTLTLRSTDAICVLLVNCVLLIMGEIRLRHFLIICKCLPDETECFPNPHEIHLRNRNLEFNMCH